MKEVGKMCAFQRKTGHISETLRDTATVMSIGLLLIANRKWHMPCQMRWKSLTLVDLKSYWQLVYGQLFQRQLGFLLFVWCHS